MAALHDCMLDARPDPGAVRREPLAINALLKTRLSGTIGATMEAALQGIPHVALSQY